MFAGPASGRQPGQPGQARGNVGVVPGQPLVEQAEGNPDAAGDGGRGGSG